MKRELWHISAHIISFHVAFRMTNVCPIRVFNNLIINNIKFFKTILLEGQKSVDILLLETQNLLFGCRGNNNFTDSKSLKMKRTSLLILVLFSAFTVFAQSAKKTVNPFGKPSFGVKAGLNFSNLSSGYEIANYLKSPATRLGPVIGAFFNLPLGQHFSFQPELSYSAEGANQDGQLGASSTYVLIFETKLSYLNIPLLLQYHTGGFYLEAGPQLGFLVGANETNKHPGTGQPSETDLKGLLKGNAFSFDLGAGYYFGSHFGIGARYAIGLTDIRSSGSNINSPLKSNVLSFSLLYKF